MDIVYIVFATFFVWETFRALAESFVPSLFALSRPVHPILAAALPLYLLWPQWVPALAVAGVVALMVASADRIFGATPVQQVEIPRRRSTKGLPTLPR